MKKPLFITFEGVEGAGKSTQIELLSKHFTSLNIPHITSREPGGLKTSEQIRSIILHENIEPVTELLLFEAARHEHVKKVILPALNSGKAVICDRFYDSSTTYQAYGRGLDIEVIHYLNKLASTGLTPDLTFILNLEASSIKARLEARNKTLDRLENEIIDFFIKVQLGFLALAKQHKRMHVIEANNSIENIFDEILKILRGHL